jgi:hypothetical protein
MSSNDLIDTSGGRPSLRLGAVVSLLIGSGAYGYVNGSAKVIDVLLGGVGDFLDGSGRWLGRVVGGLFGIPSGVIDGAFRANAAWLASLGVWGLPAAVVEVAAILLILLVVLRFVISNIGGTLS